MNLVHRTEVTGQRSEVDGGGEKGERRGEVSIHVCRLGTQGSSSKCDKKESKQLDWDPEWISSFFQESKP